VVIRCEAIQHALEDRNVAVVETNAEVRIEAIQNAVIRSVVDRASTGEVRIEVTPNAVIRSAVIQDATGEILNAGVLVVVLNAAQDVARDVVIRSAAIRFAATLCAATRFAARCVQVAVFQCVGDPGAMAVLQNAAA
jgi:hypothetical protein